MTAVLARARISDRLAVADGARAELWGVAASSVLHLAAIAALSWMLLPTTGSRSVAGLQTDWQPPREEIPPSTEVVELTSLSTLNPGGRTSTATPTPDLPRLEPRPEFDERAAVATGPLVEIADVREAAPPLWSSVAGSGSGTGTGVGDGAGGSAPAGLEFFPTTSPSGRYVFVVDCSKSMNHRYPGPAKTRLGRVKIELWRAIWRMTPEQKFFIVFFNTRAIPMPATGLVSGGPEGKQPLIDWTASIRGDQQTDPAEALLLAVRLQPDEIFFLTDGEFNHRVVREVTKANFGGIRIHTIALGDDSGAKFLGELASRNRGVYRHIVAEEDQYWESTSDQASAAADDAAALIAGERRSGEPSTRTGSRGAPSSPERPTEQSGDSIEGAPTEPGGSAFNPAGDAP